MKKHIVITGKVQGIGFRYWLYKAAIQRNIDGWVRNKISGEVEALIIGNDENVNDLIKLCEKGPTFSKVTKVKVQNYQKEYLKKSFDIINNGNETLVTSDNYTTNSEFTIINPLTSLEPGETQTVEIVYNASNANASGAYRIYSNDPDEPEIICETNGNIDGANVGETAPDFELDYVANGSGSYQLSNHLGDIIVIAFFSPM